MSDIIFVGNARCYHTMDWYRSAKEVCTPRMVLLATDVIESEGHVKLINENDNIIQLYNIDRVLFRCQSSFGNWWRNFVRVLVLPLQIARLREIARKRPGSTFHAHTMYFMLLCCLAGIKFIGTPQGSEILVRPNKSRVYKYYAKKALSAAMFITVDSALMQNRIWELCSVNSKIVQNGIDVSAIAKIVDKPAKRERILSMRGLTPMYRIDEICNARAKSNNKPNITFIYPFWDEEYKARISRKLEKNDSDLGRLPRDRMYDLMTSTLLAISIPKSDSSPRSVYEAIFCGCCVAVTYNEWIDSLPSCMMERVFIVNLDEELWMDKALEFAKIVSYTPYQPSQTALKLYDQRESMRIVAESIYI